MEDLCIEYAAFNYNNDFTIESALIAARAFDSRSMHVGLDEMTSQHMQNFRVNCLRELKPVSYNSYLAYVKVIVNWAVKNDRLLRETADLFDLLKRVKLSKAPPKYLSDVDYQTVLNYFTSPKCTERDAWFWLIVTRYIYATGCRRRQIVSLRLSDVDFKRRRIRMASRGSKNSTEWYVPMFESTAADLQHLIEVSAEALGRPLHSDEYVFNVTLFNRRHKTDPRFREESRMKPEAITKMYGRVKKATGVMIGAHRIRHTTATDLCNPQDNSAPDLFLVQTLLGHSDLNTTRIYVHSKICERSGYLENHLNKLDKNKKKLTSIV